MIDTRSYFELLPKEIVLKILKYIDTIDMINLSGAYEGFEFFTQEKNLINVTNLSKNSGFRNIPNFFEFMPKFRKEFIKVFDITNVYWVSAEDIRKYVERMINLEAFYALGTNVSVTGEDCRVYQSMKLKRLAVTIKHEDELDGYNGRLIPNLSSLCIQIEGKGKCQKIIHFLLHLQHLDELWIEDLTFTKPMHYTTFLKYFAHRLKIFAIKVPCGMFTSQSLGDHTKIFCNHKTDTEYFYEKYPRILPDPRMSTTSLPWVTLNSLHAESPYGLHDSKKLMLQKVNLDNILFEELNFAHKKTNYKCSSRYSSAVKLIISSKNTKRLKKLSLSCCLFDEEEKEAEDFIPEGNSRKRRCSCELKQQYFRILKNLRTVEQFNIDMCYVYRGCELYNFIPKMKNLTHLSLEIPKTINGSFFKSVFKNCALLHNLKINVIDCNETFHRGFCSYIGMATNLKLLRYEDHKILLENLFCGLSKLEKMEAFFLKAESAENYDELNLNKFLSKNPNVDFCTIIIETATDKTLRALADQMKTYQNCCKKVFIANKSGNIFNGAFFIPTYYRSQFLCDQNNIGGLNIEENFCRATYF